MHGLWDNQNTNDKKIDFTWKKNGINSRKMKKKIREKNEQKLHTFDHIGFALDVPLNDAIFLVF